MTGRSDHASRLAAMATAMDVATSTSEFLEHLRVIADSPAFRGSRRSRDFLRYIVRHALNGQFDQLKERSLGVVLFNRSAAYDTAEDAVVRVTASDVRKRLFRYYAEFDPNPDLRITLPPGSYIPIFEQAPDAELGAERPKPEILPDVQATRRRDTVSRSLLVTILILLGLAGVLTASLTLARHPAQGSIRADAPPWAVILDSKRPVNVILSDPDIVALQVFLGVEIPLLDYANQKYVPDGYSVPANFHLSGNSVPIVDLRAFMGIRDLARIYDCPVRAIPARKLSLSVFNSDDHFALLGSPRSDPWTALFQDKMDFVIVWDPALRHEVVRNKRPQQGELSLYIPKRDALGTGQDYAFAAFLGNPGQQGHILIMAGTTPEGTQAAAMLMTDSNRLSSTLQAHGIRRSSVPQHFQVLLQVSRMAGETKSFQIIACHRLQSS